MNNEFAALPGSRAPDQPPSHDGGWFKAHRSPAGTDLWKAHRPSFFLLYLVAARARYSDGFNPYGLAIGESLLGDCETVGLTRQEYRTALKNLKKWKFLTSRATTFGTIAKLVNSSVFSVLPVGTQPPNQPAPNQRPTNGQPTPNHYQEGIEGIEGEEGKNSSHTCTAPDHQDTEVPSLEDVKAEAARIGLPEDRAESWWQKRESENWKGVARWRPALAAYRTNWEAARKRNPKATPTAIDYHKKF